MLRRDLFSRTALCIVGAPFFNRNSYRIFAHESARYSARTIELVGRSTVIDMLGLPTLDWRKLRRWLRRPRAFSAADFAALRASGIDVFHPAVDLGRSDSHAATLQWLTSWTGFLAAHSESFLPVSGAKDFEAARQTNRVGILLGMQNSSHFRSADDVALFHRLGQRLSQLTYNSANRLGYGCIDRLDKGVTPFGAEIIAEMNRAGMAIDVSHAGDRTTLDAISLSSRPVLITHSNCRALARHPRCKTDSAIRALARNGGVMGITGIQIFVRTSGRATVEDVVNHFDHLARTAGIEHAGIGSDTDSSGRSEIDSLGLNHPQRIYALTEALVRRGYTDAHIELILGGNFRRVLAGIL